MALWPPFDGGPQYRGRIPSQEAWRESRAPIRFFEAIGSEGQLESYQRAGPEIVGFHHADSAELGEGS